MIKRKSGCRQLEELMRRESRREKGGYMKKWQYYIAYGSNLNIGQMAGRCPEAEIVGTGKLKQYELEFRGQPGNAHATITNQEGGEVPVLLWRISTEDEKQLDVYEGYPKYYDKETMEVEVDGKLYEAMVYRMQPGYERNLPSLFYYQTIKSGYQTLGFSEEVLQRAVLKEAEEQEAVFEQQLE